MPARRPAAPGALPAALLAALLAAAPGGAEAPLTAVAARRDVAVAVRVVGRLEAMRSTVVSSEVRGDRGKVVFIADDGARVRQGDVLVRLDPTPFEAEVERLGAKEKEQEAVVEAAGQMLAWERVQAERDVEKAEFDRGVAALDLTRLEKGDGPLELGRLEAAAGKAREAAAQADAYLADLEGLERRGYANPLETAAAGRRAAQARDELAHAERQLANYRDFTLPALVGKEQARVAQSAIDAEQARRASGFRIGKAAAAVRQAEQELENTRTQLKAARAELARTVIRAPIPGMVVLREDFGGPQRGKPRVGDQVWQGQALIYLPDLSRMVVRTAVREIDLHKVAVGGEAAVEVDAYPDLRLAGRVESIGVVAEGRGEGQRGAEKYFAVVVALAGEEPRLRPGMTARVAIRHAEARGALAVPVQAVFREGGREHVFVRRGAAFERRAVTTGLRDEAWAVVTAGLAPGDEVALTPPGEGR